MGLAVIVLQIWAWVVVAVMVVYAYRHWRFTWNRLSAKMEGASNPRCCCGSLMKRPYLQPILTTIRRPEELGRLRRLMEQNTK